MEKKTAPDLKDLFRQAAEIAQQVPESMQEAAFNRALDLLTGVERGNTSNTKSTPSKERSAQDLDAKPQGRGEDTPVVTLLTNIDSTRHPGVASAPNVLDRSLMVLQIALTDHEVDGLSPQDIAAILTDKFRVNTSEPAVRMSLSRATTLVNRIPRGRGYVYRIMEPGQKHLANVKPLERSAGTARPRKVRAKKAKMVEPKLEKGDISTKESKKPKRGTSSPGSFAMISELLTTGFFKSGRTISNIVEHCRTSLGHHYKANECSPALLRLLRDGKLKREKNREGQYEYTQV